MKATTRVTIIVLIGLLLIPTTSLHAADPSCSQEEAIKFLDSVLVDYILREAWEREAATKTQTIFCTTGLQTPQAPRRPAHPRHTRLKELPKATFYVTLNNNKRRKI